MKNKKLHLGKIYSKNFYLRAKRNKKKIRTISLSIILFLITLLLVFFLFDSSQNKEKIVIFKTSAGDFSVEIYDDLMPITTGNFLTLVEKDFFDNQRFHRVIDNFIIQAGDPNSKNIELVQRWGTGGPGYTIEDEFIENPKLTNEKYTISMANTGRANSSGSQFFINLRNNTPLDFDKEPLTSKHPVFGKVVSGFEIVDIIGKSNNGEIIIYDITIQ